MPITEPGIYAVSDAEYLADPVIEPSLNNTIAKLLIDASPSHAYAAHPKLGGAGDAEAEDDSDERQRIGSAAHAMFLRGSQVAKLIPFDRYQSNAAKAARDEAIAAGLIHSNPRATIRRCAWSRRSNNSAPRPTPSLRGSQNKLSCGARTTRGVDRRWIGCPMILRRRCGT